MVCGRKDNSLGRFRADVGILRLNTKIEERNLEITDLVADLSDGVSDRLWTRIVMSQC